MMCKNVGPADRIVRIVIGIAALGLAFGKFSAASGSVVGIVVAAIGVIMFATAAMGMCPLYLPFKMSTCRTQGNHV